MSKKILHVLKCRQDPYAAEIMRVQQTKGADVSLLLLHDAVMMSPTGISKVYACKDDIESRGVTSAGESVDYEAIVSLLLMADSVICW